jgi:hypothetical protein
MAAGPVTQPLLKSQPDMSRINSFETGITTTVTKHQAARGTPGVLVFPTATITKEELLALQVTLPLKNGSGYYAFTVTDAGGSGEDSWMVKLGVDPTVPQQQEGYPMAGPTFPGQHPSAPLPPAAPLDAEVKQIMPGWYFNEALGFLTTPWRETVSWRNGEPLPKPPATAGHLSAVPATATPWNWPPQPGGWGGYPVGGSSSSEIDALKAELAEANRRREMDELKAEQRRRDDEAARREQERIAEDRRREDQRIAREEQRRIEDQRREEARTKEMAELIARLTAKPAGPSEHEQRMERELLEEKRRREDSERDAARREEDRRRDEQHRAELAVMNERIERTLREANANRSDPMMTVFKEVLISQQASAAATMQTMREASAATAAVAERNAITPQQVMEMVRTTRDGASESSKTVMETMRGLMKTQQEVMTSMIEIAGQGNQPWYAGAIQEGLNKVGMIGSAMAERNAQQQQQQTEIARLQAQQQVQMRARAAAMAAPIMTPPPSAAPTPLRPVPAAGGRISATPPPPPVAPGLEGRAQHTGGRPEGTTYNKKRDLFILADGREVANAIVQEHGWGPVLAMSPHDDGAPKFPPGTTPPAAPAAVMPPHVNGSGKKTRGRRAAPVPTVEVLQPEVLSPEVTPPAPPANGQGYTIAELRDLDPDQIRLVVNPLEDVVLFGPLLPAIVDLRARVARGMPADKAAESILGSRQYLASFGGALPPAFELLMAEHYEVLVERLLPGVADDYCQAVAEMLEGQIDAENGGGEEQEEETVQ